MKTNLFLKSVSAGAIAVAMAAPTAYAQTDGDDDVIVVTATRRAETVQDVPINIAAIGGAQIEEQGFDELSDVLAYVPGINVVDRGGRQGNPIIVRGLNADALGSGDGNNDGGGTVATYLGEIPVYIDLKLNDLERVEVLLGPQGTLYGAGTLGGAIRYIPKKPDFEASTLSVRSELYQYEEADDLSTDVGFTFNTVVADNFAIRGSFDFRNDSGFIDYPFVVLEPGVSNPDPDFSDPADVAANLSPQEDVNSEETYSGRIAARWQPIDAIDATLTYYFQRTDIGGRQISSARSTVPAGKYESAKRVEEPNQIQNELIALEVIADLGFAELTSATGYSRFEDDGQRDQTDLLITLEYSYESFPTFTAFTREKGLEERINQEVRLVSKHDGPFSWIIGGFYNELETANFSAEYTPGYADFAGFDRPDDLEYFSQFHSYLEETAFFGEVSLELFERLTLTAGGRTYDYELETYDAVDFPLFDPGFVALTVDQIKNIDTSPNQSDDGTLFKFNASYEVNSDLLVYATVSEGYRIGASNGIATCDDFDPMAPVMQGACALLPGQAFGPGANDISDRDETQFGPDQTTNYEIGVKSQLLDNTLTLNGAVYYIEWTDPQVSSATVNASLPITVNADGAESRGAEISAAWRPIPALNLRGSFSHVETELTAPVPDLVRSITPPGFGTAFFDGEKGDRLPGSPENQFSFFASYEQPFLDNTLTYNFGYAWQDDILTTTGGRGGSLTLDSYGIANGSVVYDAGSWKGSLFVNNLFDEYAETGVIGNSLYNQTIAGANVRTFATHVAAPRTIGVRFTYDFSLD
ncbi:TonB-dependent receptor [Parvularcula marina]|nr:TonB-dependent receptor [Parvularcula marina]